MSPDSRVNSNERKSAAGRAPIRAFIGGSLGMAVGAVAGYGVDLAFSDEPYAGVRIGLFLGGLLGGQIGYGTGLLGIAAIMTMVLCSAIGATAPLLAVWLWRPVPMNHWLGFAFSVVGGLVGAFLGLAMAVRFLRRRADRGVQ